MTKYLELRKTYIRNIIYLQIIYPIFEMLFIPYRSTQESRALLLWWKTLQLMLRQIRYVGKVVAVVPHLTEMAQSLCRFGEDKASEGLLGVIGLGKKSIYSIQ